MANKAIQFAYQENSGDRQRQRLGAEGRKKVAAGQKEEEDLLLHLELSLLGSSSFFFFYSSKSRSRRSRFTLERTGRPS
jgi:hypothetical protein